MKNKSIRLCVAGATGAVGKALLSILYSKGFPVENIYALASSRSAGQKIPYGKNKIEVLNIANFDFSQAKIGLFSAGGSVSAEYAPKAARAGCIVVDNTSHFRMHPDVPLIVPEVNKKNIADYQKTGIIANPNCSTIQMVVALKPIYDAVGIERVNVATYQAVSGSGKKAIDELDQQVHQITQSQPLSKPQVYAKQIAFNCLPHIDVFLESGFTKEEMKMVNETKKIFSDDSIQVNPTTVRVPVVYGHSEALHIQTKEPISASQAKQLISQAEGVILMDDPSTNTYPTVLDAAHEDQVFVGRIRQGLSHPNELNMWVVADNIRKGAATNAIQIAEELISNYL
jgi:aspartate-semialdehyde dehydrogenase